jgi:hypothetical protein
MQQDGILLTDKFPQDIEFLRMPKFIFNTETGQVEGE